MTEDGMGRVWLLAGIFGMVSLVSVGGATATLPEIHRQMVDVHRFMTSQRFTDLFAVAQASPGPNLVVVTLIGWEVAGAAGAFAATAAMVLPTSIAAYLVGKVWHRFRHARWRAIIQAALTPVTIGLVMASAYVLAEKADTGWVGVALTVATAILAGLTRIHPLIPLAAGAALGAAGLL